MSKRRYNEVNLNDTKRVLETAEWKDESYRSNSLWVAQCESGPVTCYFDNLEDNLCKLIASSDGVVGCVAWLTNIRVLDEFGKKPVSLIVNTEDWLRADPPAHVWIAGETTCGKTVNIDPSIEQFDVSAVGRAVPFIWIGETTLDIGISKFNNATVKGFHSSTTEGKNLASGRQQTL